MIFEVQDKFGELYRSAPVGNPYHGKYVDGVLTLPNGATMPWVGGATCVYFKPPGSHAVSTPAAEQAQGLRYDDHVLLNHTLRYPQADGLGPVVGWIHEVAADVAWVISVPDNFSGWAMELPFSMRLATESEVFTQTLPISNPFDSNNYFILVPNHDGGKALLLMYNVGSTGCFLRRSRLRGVYEITAADGSATEPPTLSLRIVVAPEEVQTTSGVYDTTESSGNAGTVTTTYTPPSYPGFSRYETAYSPAPITTQRRQGSMQRTVVSAAYGAAGELIIFDHEVEISTTSGATKSGGGGTAFEMTTYNESGTIIGGSATNVFLQCSLDTFSITSKKMSIGVRGGLRYSYEYRRETHAINNYEGEFATQYTTGTSAFSYNLAEYLGGTKALDTYYRIVGSGSSSDNESATVLSGLVAGQVGGYLADARNAAIAPSLNTVALWMSPDWSAYTGRVFVVVSENAIVDLAGNPFVIPVGQSSTFFACAHPLTGEVVTGFNSGFV